MKKNILSGLCFVLFAVAFSPILRSESEQESKRTQMVEKAVAYLRGSQGENGAYSPSPRSGIGPTGVVIAGLLEIGMSPEDPMVAKGLQFMQKAVHEDGGIYTAGGMFGNYESCIAVMCFVKANQWYKENKKQDPGPYEDMLRKAEKYVRACQYTEEQGKTPEDPYYGGSGYGAAGGRSTRPDLSNTHFFIETLKSLGAGEEDPAIQKALIFVSRCQNLESEHNALEFASKNQDGGFIYNPIDESGSPAGETAGGGLRSYGSMTYAGLKSMIYAGLKENDPRVKAAYDWVKKHYDLQSNPGLGQAGLYYYYQLLSKTLDILELKTLSLGDGKEINWRSELIETLAQKQREDGSWANENARWMENDPNLVTGYVLMVLADCKP